MISIQATNARMDFHTFFYKLIYGSKCFPCFNTLYYLLFNDFTSQIYNFKAPTLNLSSDIFMFVKRFSKINYCAKFKKSLDLLHQVYLYCELWIRYVHSPELNRLLAFFAEIFSIHKRLCVCLSECRRSNNTTPTQLYTGKAE